MDDIYITKAKLQINIFPVVHKLSTRINRLLATKPSEVISIAATNISFLYFSERIFNLAEDYAYISVKTSQYNAKALVNKGK